jgi:hypothetical protein
VGEFGVDFVDEVAEVGGCLIIDVFEEHDCFEVLCKILDLIVWHFPLEYFDDILLFCVFDFFCQVDNFFLDIDKSLNVFANLAHLHVVTAHDLLADLLDFYVGLVRYLVDEVPDGQLGALRKDVQDVLALHETASLYRPHYRHLALSRHELTALVVLLRLLEEHDPAVVHQVLQELLLLHLEEEAPVGLELEHLLYLLVVVVDREVGFGLVYYHHHPLFDVLEGLEGLQQILSQFGQFVGSGLADVGVVNDQYDFDFGVDVQEALHEEGVGYFVFFSFVVFEAGTVVEGQVLVDDQLVGD